jgi:drug/metabolite transporter (DMT)-like permease
MSYFLIGETVTKHDLLAFFLGVTGIALLTDPFSSMKGYNDVIGIFLALLSSVIFNLGFISVRFAKEHLKSWQIVFYFTITNMMLSPPCLIGE